MADEIIKLLEYLMNNPSIQAGATVVLIVYAVLFLLAVGFIGFVFWQIIKGFNDDKW